MWRNRSKIDVIQLYRYVLVHLHLLSVPTCIQRERVKAASVLVGSSLLDEASYDLVVAVLSHPIEE